MIGPKEAKTTTGEPYPIFASMMRDNPIRLADVPAAYDLEHRIKFHQVADSRGEGLVMEVGGFMTFYASSPLVPIGKVAVYVQREPFFVGVFGRYESWVPEWQREQEVSDHDQAQALFDSLIEQRRLAFDERDNLAILIEKALALPFDPQMSHEVQMRAILHSGLVKLEQSETREPHEPEWVPGEGNLYCRVCGGEYGAPHGEDDDEYII